MGGCTLEQEGQNFYIVGADAVRKKLGSGQHTIKATAGYHHLGNDASSTTMVVSIYVDDVLVKQGTGTYGATAIQIIED